MHSIKSKLIIITSCCGLLGGTSCGEPEPFEGTDGLTETVGTITGIQDGTSSSALLVDDILSAILTDAEVIADPRSPVFFTTNDAAGGQLLISGTRSFNGVPDSITSVQYVATNGWSADVIFDPEATAFRFKGGIDRELEIRVIDAAQLELTVRDANGAEHVTQTLPFNGATTESRTTQQSKVPQQDSDSIKYATIRVHATCDGQPVEWLQDRLKVIFDRSGGPIPDGELYPRHVGNGWYVIGPEQWSLQDSEPFSCEELLNPEIRQRLCQNDDLDLFLELLTQKWFADLVTAVLKESAEALVSAFLQIVNDHLDELTDGEVSIPTDFGESGGAVDDLDRLNLALMTQILTDIKAVFCIDFSPCQYISNFQPTEQDSMTVYAEVDSAPCGGMSEPVQSDARIEIRHPWPAGGITLNVEACDNADRHRVLATLDWPQGGSVVMQHTPAFATPVGTTAPPVEGFPPLANTGVQAWKHITECEVPPGNSISITETEQNGGVAFELLNQSATMIEGAFRVGGRINRHTKQVRRPTAEELLIFGSNPGLYCEQLMITQSVNAFLTDFMLIQYGEEARIRLLLEPENLPPGAVWSAEVSVTDFLSSAPPQRYNICIAGPGDVPAGCDGPASVPLDIRIPYELSESPFSNLPPTFFDSGCMTLQVSLSIAFDQELEGTGESRMGGRAYFRIAAEPSK